METSISTANHAVLHAQNNRLGLGPMEFSNSGANLTVSHAQITRRSLGPIETCNSDPKEAVLHANTTDEGRNPKRLAILVLKSLLLIPKTLCEVWDQ